MFYCIFLNLYAAGADTILQIAKFLQNKILQIAKVCATILQMAKSNFAFYNRLLFFAKIFCKTFADCKIEFCISQHIACFCKFVLRIVCTL